MIKRKTKQTTRTAVRKAMVAQLTEAEQRLMEGRTPAIHTSIAHIHLLTAVSLITGRSKRSLLEGTIEEVARRYGLPMPPVQAHIAHAHANKSKVDGRDKAQAEILAHEWPELWNAIEGIVGQRERAYATLNPAPVPMDEYIAAKRSAKTVATEPVNENPDWEPDALDQEDDDLLAQLQGLG